jgi:hypothetical protein
MRELDDILSFIDKASINDSVVKQQIKELFIEIILSADREQTSKEVHALAELFGRKQTITELLKEVEKL